MPMKVLDTEARDLSLSIFREDAGYDPAHDLGVGYAVSGALTAQFIEHVRRFLGYVQDSGFGKLARTDRGIDLAPKVLDRQAPLQGLAPPLQSSLFARLVASELRKCLLQGNVQESAAALLISLEARFGTGGLWDTRAQGFRRDAAHQKFATLICYLWPRLGRDPLSAERLYQLAHGVGIASEVRNPDKSWGPLIKKAHGWLERFDPTQAVPAMIDDPKLLDANGNPIKRYPEHAIALVELYAARGHMVYDPIKDREVRPGPTHDELVEHIIATQPEFDTVAVGRGQSRLLEAELQELIREEQEAAETTKTTLPDA